MKRPYLVSDGRDAAPTRCSFTASAISPIEDIIEDARNGRPYILVDAEDPGENEGGWPSSPPSSPLAPSRSISWPGYTRAA